MKLVLIALLAGLLSACAGAVDRFRDGAMASSNPAKYEQVLQERRALCDSRKDCSVCATAEMRLVCEREATELDEQ